MFCSGSVMRAFFDKLSFAASEVSSSGITCLGRPRFFLVLWESGSSPPSAGGSLLEGTGSGMAGGTVMSGAVVESAAGSGLSSPWLAAMSLAPPRSTVGLSTVAAFATIVGSSGEGRTAAAMFAGSGKGSKPKDGRNWEVTLTGGVLADDADDATAPSSS